MNNHFELNCTYKASMNGRSCDVYSKAKTCEPTFTFYSGGNFALQVQFNPFFGPSKN